MSKSRLRLLVEFAQVNPDAFAAWLDRQPVSVLDAIDTQDWSIACRPEQALPEGSWSIWFLVGGRGSGKTRAGAEATRELISALEGELGRGTARWALVGQRLKDVRLTMVEGETGLLRCLPPSMLVEGSIERSWNRSTVELTLDSGSILQGYTSEVPGDLMGPQQHGAWVDEPGKFEDAHKGITEDTTWSNLRFGTRLKPWNRTIVTGTPKRRKLVRDLLALDGIITTRMTTYDNLVNLSDDFRAEVVDFYEGTRLGRQELYGEMLEAGGTRFARADFVLVDEPAPASARRVRYVDLAATEPHGGNTDPDYTAAVKVAYEPDRKVWTVEHVDRFRLNTGARDERLRQIAEADGLHVIHIEQEPGAAGKAQMVNLGAFLDGVARVKGDRVTGSKETRAEIVEGPVEQHRVEVLAGQWWSDAFLDEHEDFPNGDHDDIVDATSGAFSKIRQRHQTVARSAVGQTLDSPLGEQPLDSPLARR